VYGLMEEFYYDSDVYSGSNTTGTFFENLNILKEHPAFKMTDTSSSKGPGSCFPNLIFNDAVLIT
jgi:hypothetical protein